jgi:hypothetical protein
VEPTAEVVRVTGFHPVAIEQSQELKSALLADVFGEAVEGEDRGDLAEKVDVVKQLVVRRERPDGGPRGGWEKPHFSCDGFPVDQQISEDFHLVEYEGRAFEQAGGFLVDLDREITSKAQENFLVDLGDGHIPTPVKSLEAILMSSSLEGLWFVHGNAGTEIQTPDRLPSGFLAEEELDLLQAVILCGLVVDSELEVCPSL